MILANRKPEGQELREMVEVWQKTLAEIIPLEKIAPAWKRTLALHKSDFPPTAFSVLKSFHELEAAEQEREIENQTRDREENPVKYCNYRQHHINEHGDVLEMIGGLGGEDVVLPCPFCRKDAYTVRYAEEKRKYIERHNQEPERLVINESNVLQMFAKHAKDEI